MIRTLIPWILLTSGALCTPTSAAFLVDNISYRQINNSGKVSIPQLDTDQETRARDVASRREGYLYAPSLMGNASYHIGGTLGIARIQKDIASWLVDRNKQNASIEVDLATAKSSVVSNFGLDSVEDYAEVLYQNQWNLSVPGGEAPGILTNYTHDLLFSMERLSLNPYPLRRVKPTDPLPFPLAFNVTKVVANLTLERLQSSGRLFVVDHSYQASFDKVPNKYGAACTAYFFIHPQTQDFLPLAIKTNTGSDLIYTPLDTAEDWLLAKLMFNVNDLIYSQMYHLVGSHDVAEPVHTAALRTLSDNHPVSVILERLQVQAFAIRPLGERMLINLGGPIDQAFHVSSNGARQAVAELYPTGGSFEKNYLETHLRSQGLISTSQPGFKSFPFYKDALAIRNSLRTFFTIFVNSYYSSDEVVAGDTELQAWFVEATEGAKVIDFPDCGKAGKPCGKKTLVEVLTHFAYLTSVAHHALNTGDPVTSSATLPFHPAALYAPLPRTKGVTAILPFLPPPPNALFHIAIFAAFNRPQFEAENRTLIYAFSDEEAVLGRLNTECRIAAGVFEREMKELSRRIRRRSFDADGLSEGMPFVWKSLDPGTVPWFLAI